MTLTKKKNYNLKDYAKREVNLLPSEIHTLSKSKIYAIAALIVMMCFVMAFAFYEYTIYNDTKDYEDSTLNKRAIIQVENKNLSNQNIIMSLEDRILVKENILGFIYSTNRSLTDIIALFEQSLNNEVYLSSIMANSSDALTLSATATNYKAISAFISKMKLIKTDDEAYYFDSVFTRNISRNLDAEGNILFLFQLECKFGGEQ